MLALIFVVVILFLKIPHFLPLFLKLLFQFFVCDLLASQLFLKLVDFPPLILNLKADVLGFGVN